MDVAIKSVKIPSGALLNRMSEKAYSPQQTNVLAVTSLGQMAALYRSLISIYRVVANECNKSSLRCNKIVLLSIKFYKQKVKILAGHPANSGNSPNKTYFLTANFANRLASEAVCLVLGSEGNGLSYEALDKAELISIPMEGMFESLNVSVAGGIFLFMLQPQNQRD